MAAKTVFYTSYWHHYYLYSGVLVLLLLGGVNLVDGRGLLGGVLVVGSILLFFVSELIRKSHRVTVDDDGVLYERGIFTKQRIQVHFLNISDVTARKNIIQRILGYGDLSIATPGSDTQEIVLQGFPRPNVIQAYVQKRIHGMKVQTASS